MHNICTLTKKKGIGTALVLYFLYSCLLEITQYLDCSNLVICVRAAIFQVTEVLFFKQLGRHRGLFSFRLACLSAILINLSNDNFSSNHCAMTIIKHRQRFVIILKVCTISFKLSDLEEEIIKICFE